MKIQFNWIKKSLLGFLAAVVIISASACTPIVKEPEPKPNVKMLSVINGPLSKEIDTLIRSKTPLVELGKTLNSKLGSASTDDADSALLLYARYAETESQNMISDLIYSNPETTDKFYKIYGETFNYTWDETLINTIQDQEMKSILRTFDDSYLKVQQYGDYIGPMVNYDKLSKASSISESLKTFYTNVETLYNTTKSATQITGLNYNQVAILSTNIEDIFKSSTQPLLKDFSESMLTYSLNSYYVGTENSSPFDYDKKTLSDAFLKAAEINNKQFADYHLGKLGKLYLDMAKKNNNELTIEYADLVMNYKKFGFDSNKAVTSVKNVKGKEYIEMYPQFDQFEDEAIEEMINKDVVRHVEKLKETIQWSKTKNTNYNISFIVDFANENYLSLQLYASSFNSDTSVNLYDNKALTYNLKTGKAVTLKDIFKEDYENNVAAIKALVEKDIIETQKLDYKVVKTYDILDNVVLDKNYLIVVLKKGIYSDEQKYDINSYVKYGDLLPTFDMMSYLNQ